MSTPEMGLSSGVVMRAAICGVIHANHETAGKQPLHASAPLVDFRVSILLVAQIALVAEPPLRELSIRVPLRRRKAGRERVGQRRVLRLIEILREVDRSAFIICFSGILEIGSDIRSVVHPGASPDYGL